MDEPRIKIFSFFSGSGFLDLGFEKSGCEIVLVNEFQHAFIDAYKYARKNMGIEEPVHGYYENDINDFLSAKKSELERMILGGKEDKSLVGFIGGPPCPDFSVAGKNKGRDGDNGKLSLSYIRLITTMKPDFFLFENVKGLWRTAAHRQFFEELIKKLHHAGYCTTARLTNALEYGAPQDRDRILMFGIRKNLLKTSQYKRNELLDFPWLKYQTHTMDAIKSIEWPEATQFVADSVYDCPADLPQEMTVEYWFKLNDVENHPNAHDHFTPRKGLKRMKTVDEGDVSKKSYKRPHRWRYSPTVAYGNNEVHLHPYKERRISAAEAMALQTLPVDFVLPANMTLTNMFKTIGNGVPFILAKGIAGTIKDYLGELQ
jgi:DNA (cytosine-5)-methyltransferase 1